MVDRELLATENHPDHGAYWEARARRFATRDEGWAAVCSYGMPRFYNRAIEACQRRALLPWLGVAAGSSALDAGCGVGRWSRLLAARGANVTGVDLSLTMVKEAERRAAVAGLAERCRFLACDLRRLDLGRRYALVVAVTVLQHLPDIASVQAAVARLAAHLELGGRLVVLEAMPSRPLSRCDTAFFTARPWGEYQAVFLRAGLELVALTGVDPAPFKTWLLPHYRSLPPLVAKTALAIATASSFPIDRPFGRLLVRSSWHKVAVLEAARST